MAEFCIGGGPVAETFTEKNKGEKQSATGCAALFLLGFTSKGNCVVYTFIEGHKVFL